MNLCYDYYGYTAVPSTDECSLCLHEWEVQTIMYIQGRDPGNEVIVLAGIIE